MANAINYNPNPPRVWSRVQNQCTYIIDSSYNSIYVPLTNKTVSLLEANYQDKLLYKGNILQYKKNSSSMSKNQKYSQIAKGLGSSKKKSYATQSTTYTNPNTTGLKRVNYDEIPFPNQVVGSPNNISGPFQYGIPNPDKCPTTTLQNGGNLVCNAFANSCTGAVTQNLVQRYCYPTYCSDVPGYPINLCWNPKIQTFYPRQRYTMNNSLNKWPQGYKGFVTAETPAAPVLSLDSYTNNNVVLSWTYINNECLPISSFYIYENDILINIVPYTVTTINIPVTSGTFSFYIISFSTTISSPPSNTVTITV
jgi:hypothetical protein